MKRPRSINFLGSAAQFAHPREEQASKRYTGSPPYKCSLSIPQVLLYIYYLRHNSFCRSVSRILLSLPPAHVLTGPLYIPQSYISTPLFPLFVRRLDRSRQTSTPQPCHDLTTGGHDASSRVPVGDVEPHCTGHLSISGKEATLSPIRPTRPIRPLHPDLLPAQHPLAGIPRGQIPRLHVRGIRDGTHSGQGQHFPQAALRPDAGRVRQHGGLRRGDGPVQGKGRQGCAARCRARYRPPDDQWVEGLACGRLPELYVRPC